MGQRIRPYPPTMRRVQGCGIAPGIEAVLPAQAETCVVKRSPLALLPVIAACGDASAFGPAVLAQQNGCLHLQSSAMKPSALADWKGDNRCAEKESAVRVEGCDRQNRDVPRGRTHGEKRSQLSLGSTTEGSSTRL